MYKQLKGLNCSRADFLLAIGIALIAAAFIFDMVRVYW